MDVVEIVSEIIEMYDEITELRRENMVLRKQINSCKDDVPREEQVPEWFADVYKYGHDAIWKEFGERKYYPMVVTIREDDDGRKIPQSFESWYKERYEKFPPFMSANDFLVEFGEELHDKYDTEKLKALGYLEDE